MGDMHVLSFALALSKSDETIIDKRFGYMFHIHNTIVSYATKQLRKISFDKGYKELKAEYGSIIYDKKGNRKRLNQKEEARRNELAAAMKEIISSYGLTQNGLESYIKVCGKRYSKHLSSQQVQKEADRVYKGVEKVLYSAGKKIRFKKYRDFHTISGKTNTNGVKFDKSALSIEWNGLTIKCKKPDRKSAWYYTEALKGDISYCEIKRRMFPNGWHYYLLVYLRGSAPHKIKEVGSLYNVMGIDIGTSTIATVSEDMAVLEELAPGTKEYNAKIVELQKRMGASKRISNPKKYKPDGTIDKSNKDKWIFSNNYNKLRNRLNSLYRQKSAYIKQSHQILANKLIRNSASFIVENMSFKKLQKKVKKTERSEKQTQIISKNGTIKMVCKYKRKKRFGRSMNNRAPASLISIIKEKAAMYGGELVEVDAKTFKASQYDHSTGTYTKVGLNKRDKFVNGQYVQRDLYSAFLLRNSNKNHTKPVKKKCEEDFKRYLKLQNDLIAKMKANNITMKQCFGF